MGGASFTPRSGNWKWNKGGVWQSEEAQITGINNGNPLLLRYCVHDIGGKTANNQATILQYSTNKSSWYDCGAQSATDKTFRYRDDASLTDGDPIDQARLSCNTENGCTHETPEVSGYEDYIASCHHEVEFVIEPYDMAASTTYYFRMTVGGIEATLNAEASEYANLVSAAGAVAKGFPDSIGLSDDFSKAITFDTKNFSDSISMSDIFSILFKAMKFSDEISVSDAFATPYKEMAFTDAITIADTFNIVLKTLGFSDAITIADVFNKELLAVPKQFSDSISVADTFAITLKLLGFSDSISVADAFATNLKMMVFSDSISITDAFTILKILNFADSITIVSAFNKAVAGEVTPKDFADSITLATMFDKVVIIVKKPEKPVVVATIPSALLYGIWKDQQ